MTMEIKVGDKVRIANDAPSEYRYGFNYRLRTQESEVVGLDDNGFMAAILPLCVSDRDLWFQIPTKYLTKVEDEAKEPKFKAGEIVRYRYDGNLYIVECKTGRYYYALRQVGGDIMMHDVLESDLELVTEPKQEIKVGDVIDTPKGKGTVRISYGDYWVVQLDNGVWYIHTETNMPYTEPKEQTEAEKKPNIGSIKIPVEVDLTDSYWDAYTADFAKEIVLKVANKYSDPKEAAEYAVSVAKAVVENLKKK